MAAPVTNVLNALLASGFPFQMAIAQTIKQVPDWKIECEEFPWRDDSGTDRFLDLVIYRENLILAVECKKTEKDIFTFLQPTGASQSIYRARCLYLTQIQDESRRMEIFCGDWDIKPTSIESAFCVVSTSDKGKDQRMLEKDAQLVVRGAYAFGKQCKLMRPRALGAPDRVIVPVIVTNGKLFSATFDPASVSLDTGKLPIDPVPHISAVEWVRFRKAFTAIPRQAGDRTVFVIAASSLQQFLQDVSEEYSRQSPRGSNLIPDYRSE